MSSFIHEKILRGKRTVLFGTGSFSEHFNQRLFNIIYYVDNDASRWGTALNGKEISSPERLLSENKQDLVIIVVSSYYKDIALQLNSLGFKQGLDFFDGNDLLDYIYATNIHKLKSLKNIHAGQRAFIIGNGPSLTVEDLNKLKNEITFASNKIYLAFKDTVWRPTYYTVVDDLIASNNIGEITSEVDTLKFMPLHLKPLLGEQENTLWLKTKVQHLKNGNRTVTNFSEDCSKEIYAGATVTYFNLQIAYHMGIREVYLLGVDHYYPGLHSMKKPAGKNEKFIEEGNNKTHFVQGYNKTGEVNYLPDFKVQNEAYQTAYEFYKNHNGKIFNASRSTHLDVFPLAYIDKVLNTSLKRDVSNEDSCFSSH